MQRVALCPVCSQKMVFVSNIGEHLLWCCDSVVCSNTPLRFSLYLQVSDSSTTLFCLEFGIWTQTSNFKNLQRAQA